LGKRAPVTAGGWWKLGMIVLKLKTVFTAL
jgi:hypothetical protein